MMWSCDKAGVCLVVKSFIQIYRVLKDKSCIELFGFV